MLSTTVLGQNLSKHRWQKRLILVTTKDDTLWNKQNEIIKNCQEEADERKLIVLRNTSKESQEVFKVQLIGLDGGVKYSSDIPFSCEKVFALIDAMPMRKQEIRTLKN